MQPTLLVMIGGAFGAAARFQLGRLSYQIFGGGVLGGGVMGTLLANILGGLLMGILVGFLSRLDGSWEPWRLFLGVGLLGGFTTFSAFSLDVINLIERGHWGLALGYALVSVGGSVLALFAGLFTVRSFA